MVKNIIIAVLSLIIGFFLFQIFIMPKVFEAEMDEFQKRIAPNKLKDCAVDTAELNKLVKICFSDYTFDGKVKSYDTSALDCKTGQQIDIYDQRLREESFYLSFNDKNELTGLKLASDRNFTFEFPFKYDHVLVAYHELLKNKTIRLNGDDFVFTETDNSKIDGTKEIKVSFHIFFSESETLFFKTAKFTLDKDNQIIEFDVSSL